MTESPEVFDLLLKWEELSQAGVEATAEALFANYPELTDAVRAGIDRLRRINRRIHVDQVDQLAAGVSKVEPAPRKAPEFIGPDIPKLTEWLAPSTSNRELGFLAHYRILQELGRGGMGIVLLAEDTQLQRLVALKVIDPVRGCHPHVRERFLREARAAAKLKHDNIITIFQVGEERGALFIAMEYLKGSSLEDYLQRGPKLSTAHIIRLAREMIEGLKAAHAVGLIHRDIKPANIWLEAPKGRVKILDFGLVFDQETGSQSSNPSVDDPVSRQLAQAILKIAGPLTRSGVVGTPKYMSPEQAAGKVVDARSDLFSLGTVLYRMCARQEPFRGTTLRAVLESIATHTPTPIRDLNPEIPIQLAQVVERMIAKDPTKRFQSAIEVGDALRVVKKVLAELDNKSLTGSFDLPSLPTRDQSLVSTIATSVTPKPDDDGLAAHLGSSQATQPGSTPRILMPALNEDRASSRHMTIGGMAKPAAMLLAGLIAIGALVAYSFDLIARREFEKDVAQSKSKLESLVNTGNEADIKAFVDALMRDRPDVAAAIDVEKSLHQIHAIAMSEKARSQLFEQALANAESLPRVGPPDPLILERLDRLASTKSEKAQVRRYRNEREVIRDPKKEEEQKEAEVRLNGQLAALQKEVLQLSLKTYDRDKLERAKEILIDLKYRLGRIEANIAKNNWMILDEARDADRAILNANNLLSKHLREITSIESVTQSLVKSTLDLSSVRERLSAAASTIEGAERRRAFQAAVEESKTWETVLFWDKLLSDCQGDFLLLTTDTAAKQRAARIAEWAEKAADVLTKEGSPIDFALVYDYIESLRATSRSRQSLSEIEDLFRRSDVRNLYFLRTKQKQIYYVEEDPDIELLKAKSSTARTFIWFKPIGPVAKREPPDGVEPKAKQDDPPLRRPMKLIDYDGHGKAPQSEIATTILLEDLSAANVDKLGLEGTVTKIVSERILHRQDMDSVLAVILIHGVLQSAAKADTAIAAELAPLIKRLNDPGKTGVDLNVDWTDPNDMKVQAARDAAKQFLGALPFRDVHKFPVAVAKRRQKLENDLKANWHRAVGWLYEDVQDGWKIAQVRSLLKAKRDLKVLRFRDGMAAEWVTIGQIKDGKMTIHAEDPTALMEGRMVFVQGE